VLKGSNQLELSSRQIDDYAAAARGKNLVWAVK
jgi:hypothetical protein